MDPEQSFFSIIVPTYNRPRQLAECLRALSALDYPRHRFEVIVVDDGSDPTPRGVVSSFRSQLQVMLLVQNNAGPATARNHGVAHAKGEFIAFTDDDCLPTGHWLKALAAHFAAGRRQAIAGRTINALPHNPFATTSQLIIDMVHAYYNADPHQARFSASNNLALPAEMFRSLGGFDEAFRVSEDRDLTDRWLRHGHRLIYAPDVLVYHAPALTGRSFWWQHFHYGRGAFHYHRARARRDSGPFRPDLNFYLHVLRSLPQMLEQKHNKHALSLALLLAVWQLANTTGFLWEKIKDSKGKNGLSLIKMGLAQIR